MDETPTPRVKMTVFPVGSVDIEVELKDYEVAEYLTYAKDEKALYEWLCKRTEIWIDRVWPEVDYWDTKDLPQLVDMPNPDLPLVHKDQMTIDDVL